MGFANTVDAVVDYGGKKAHNSYDVKQKIAPINSKLIKYFESIETVIEQEKAYGINVSNYQIDGVCPALKPANDILTEVAELKELWQTIKKNIKDSTLDFRIANLTKLKEPYANTVSSYLADQPGSNFSSDSFPENVRNAFSQANSISTLIDDAKKRKNQ